MERAISEMERIKRAEEIYSKRNNLDDSKSYEKKSRNIYKSLFQFILLIDIAIGIVAFQNREYIFSENFINQVNSYNVNIKEKIEEFTTDETDSEETEENTNTTEEVETTEIQGAIVENEAYVELSQMELDTKEILENYSIILPVSGTKTSPFGQRDSSNSIVTSNHTGVDIGATSGTVIVAAHSGTITQVSSEGDYGNHLRISDGNLTTLYAHCLQIYVTEGQEVEQGEKIAEVGSTGNSTGPHLHFEIIYEERYVDPELIIEI